MHRLPLQPLKNLMLAFIFVPLEQKHGMPTLKLSKGLLSFQLRKLRISVLTKHQVKNSLNLNRTWIFKALTDFF